MGEDMALNTEAKRKMLGTMIQQLHARAEHNEQALASERQMSKALQEAIEVLRQQHVCLQQQLAWVTHSWQYLSSGGSQQEVMAQEFAYPNCEAPASEVGASRDVGA